MSLSLRIVTHLNTRRVNCFASLEQKQDQQRVVVEQQKAVVKIFIAYPGDCKAARQAIVDIIKDNDYRWHEHFDIRVVYWEDPDLPVLGEWNAAPQQSVVQHVGDPASCDLLIALFHSRIGSTLPELDFGLDENKNLWTGTCWELARASAASRLCWVFRNMAEANIDLMNLSMQQARDKIAQAAAVKSFFSSKIKDADGSYCRSAFEYHTPQDFAHMVRDKLRRWFKDQIAGRQTASPVATAPSTLTAPLTATLNAAQQELLTRITDQQSLDYESLDLAQRQRFDVLLGEVCQSPVSNLQAYLLKRYAQWANRDGGRLQSKFVQLDLRIHRGPDSDAEFYEKRGNTHNSLTGLLAANADVRGLVLTGDPGCGKTTILQHHEMFSAAEALRALCSANSKAIVIELCLWYRLSGFASGDTPAEWLRLQQHELAVQQLQQWQLQQPRIRVRYLLDGLNEIQVNSDRQYRESLRQWSAWAAAGEARGELAPLFSVRRRNLSPALTSGELNIHQISVQRWSDQNIQQYIEHRFGAATQAATQLWQQIDADPRLREQCSLPLDLKHQCDIYAALGRPANSRAELFGALCWQRLLRLHSRETLDDLLHPTDIKALDSSAQWKRRLLNLPDQGALLQTLYLEAAAMHRDGVQVERDEASLALQLEESERQQWCDAMLKLPFLEQVSEENPALRFIHQNWQEYFAAAALAQMPSDQWPDFSAAAPVALEQELAGLGNLDALPGPPISHWDEAAKFAVQIASSEQRMALLQQLQRQNLALAGRAVAALRPLAATIATIGDGTQTTPCGDWLGQLRQALLQRSRDPAVDLRLRIQSAEALGEVGDPRYQQGISPDGVYYLIPKDPYWIEFPAGTCTIGLEDGEEDERPPISVELPAFSVAFATVTNAEYRCFYESDGYQDMRWWPGTAGEWVRGKWRDQVVIDWWQRRLTVVRELIKQHDTDKRRIQAVMGHELFIHCTLANAEEWLHNAKVANDVADEWLEGRYGQGEPKAEPEHWRNPQFNQPAQPVVGVTAFEAQAYCLWIAHHSGSPFQLPSEALWEAAARGQTARRWPFSEVIDNAAQQFNHEPTHLRRAAPAGCFPAGDSEEGLLDMAGNVWEWSATAYAPELAKKNVTAKVVSDESVPRVLRGGGCNSTAFVCRASNRLGNSPGNRDDSNGFRLFSSPIH